MECCWCSGQSGDWKAGGEREAVDEGWNDTSPFRLLLIGPRHEEAISLT